MRVVTLSSSSISSMLLLILMFLPRVLTVCKTCGGEACDGADPSTCPWIRHISSNAAAVGAAVGGVLTLSKLLPPKLLRVFPISVCNVISTLVARPTQGREYDPEGKSLHELYVARQSGIIEKEHARVELSRRLSAVTGTDEESTLERKNIAMYLQLINEVAPTHQASGTVGDGPFLFILCRVSNMISKSSKVDVTLCHEVEAELTKAPNKAFAATLSRPNNADEMYSILNFFVTMLVASGLCHTLAIVNFLETVVYEPIRRGRIQWYVAFELMVLYLMKVEDEPDSYRLTNVVAALGGMDSYREEATKVAQAVYPASFFRVDGGNPGSGNHSNTKKYYTGVIRGFNEESKTACQAWNKGTQHLASDVSPDGTCKFFHGCSQFLVPGVEGAGSQNQCFQAHKFKDGCTRPEVEKKAGGKSTRRK